MTVDRNEIIDYKYLDMDNQKFVPSQQELLLNLVKGSLLMAIPNNQHNQVLIAGSKKSFHRIEAIQLCRKLSGLDRFGEVKTCKKQSIKLKRLV